MNDALIQKRLENVTVSLDGIKWDFNKYNYLKRKTTFNPIKEVIHINGKPNYFDLAEFIYNIKALQSIAWAELYISWNIRKDFDDLQDLIREIPVFQKERYFKLYMEWNNWQDEESISWLKINCQPFQKWYFQNYIIK